MNTPLTFLLPLFLSLPLSIRPTIGYTPEWNIFLTHILQHLYSVYMHGIKPQDHGVYLLYGLVHTNYALSLDVETLVCGIPFMPCMYLSNWLLVGEIKVRIVGPRPG